MTVTAIIKSEGKEVPHIHSRLLSIDISREFNKVPRAEIKLKDGSNKSDQADTKFEVLNSDAFEPGKKIEISLKNEGDLSTATKAFTGIVVNQTLEMNGYSGTILTIELCHEAIRMTSVRKRAVYKNQADDKIIESLISRNGLKGTAEAMKVTHAEMVQYHSTDWDFMLSRAEANGHVVMIDDDTISTLTPEVDEKNPLEIENESGTILDIDLQASGLHQYQEVSSLSWDTKEQALTKPEPGTEYKVKQGNYKVKDMAKALGTEEVSLVQFTSMQKEERKAWSDAQMIKSRLSLLRGSIKVKGSGKFKIGKTIKFIGLSDRFTGLNVITGIRQAYSLTDGWCTYIQIGMDSTWFTAQPDIVDTQAAGLLPGVNGLQIGIVEAHEKDTENQFRIRVSIPAFGHSNTAQGAIWARLASIDAGEKHSVLFYPEKGDEVVVGFLNDDPRQAVILGAMHSDNAKKAPPVLPSEKNGQKGIFTRSGYQLLFDDENETITLSTADTNKICIDQKKKSINLEDANGNQVELNEKGVTITSFKDVQINAKGNLNLEAKGNIKIKGKKVDLI